MILTFLQFAAFVVVAISLIRWRVCLSRRNSESWDSLLARLKPGWSAHNLSDDFLVKEGLSAPPEEIWELMQGARGLWAMYRNAGVMLEMADYAERNGAFSNSELTASLRGDAMQIRVGALTTLAQFALNTATDSVRFNAFHVASQYTGMSARMTHLLEEIAPAFVPEFAAAM